jgi:methionyl-tRNA formyltransferase
MFSIIFFGSFQEYSVAVLDKLAENFQITAVVTTPPAPKGRHLQLTPTEVSVYSKKHNLPLFELSELKDIPFDTQPDFFVVAGYGKLLPSTWLAYPKVMAVNLHPSLLPKYPGRFPAEWAILNNETTTGISLIQMSPEFDKGDILFQTPIPISPDDTKHTLYQKLFTLGADSLITTLPQIASGQITPLPQSKEKVFYARGLTREDGFVPFEEFKEQSSRSNSPLLVKLRALNPWPGVWTIHPNGQRIKLISLSPLTTQEENKTPKQVSSIK